MPPPRPVGVKYLSLLTPASAVATSSNRSIASAPVIILGLASLLAFVSRRRSTGLWRVGNIAVVGLLLVAAGIGVRRDRRTIQRPAETE